MWIVGLFEVSGWIFVLLLVLFATYLYQTWHPLYWRRRAVPGPTIYPFLGTLGKFIRKGPAICDLEDVAEYGKVYGACISGINHLMVADEELLKEVLVQNFSTYVNRVVFEFGDEVTMAQLTALKDDDWRRVRNMLTPTFSTGKLKLMMRSVKECVDLLDENLGKLCDGREMFECKELFGAYTMDVIARTAFGIKVDSQKEENSKFVRAARKAFDFDILSKPIILVISDLLPWLLPYLVRYFNYNFIDKESMKFFTDIVEQSMASREEGDTDQKDFVQLMVNAHKLDVDSESVAKDIEEIGGEYDHTHSTSQKGLTKTEILAQGFLFFVAGYDTTASTLTMLAYNLACWPDVQDKLYEELLREYDNEEVLDYHSLSKCAYLDQCIDESLRLCPPVLQSPSKDTTLGGIQLVKGDAVTVPIYAIHHHPDFYPDPEEFRPERFTPEAKAARSPFHYMPFGYGPRSCIGMRLAQMEVKAAMIQAVRKYRFLVCDKTERPLVFKKELLLKARNGVWLLAEKRDKK